MLAFDPAIRGQDALTFLLRIRALVRSYGTRPELSPPGINYMYVVLCNRSLDSIESERPFVRFSADTVMQKQKACGDVGIRFEHGHRQQSSD